MPSENTALKSSFFKEYYRHKMRGLKGFTITFLVMNMLITVGLAACVLIYVIMYSQYVNTSNYSGVYYSGLGYSFYFGGAYLVLIAEVILTAVMAAINFKYYNNRSAMDTIGGLPLTVSQRFWGDFLSGAASIMLSFIPGSVIALILMAAAQFGIAPEVHAKIIGNGTGNIFIMSGFEDNFLLLGLVVLLSLFFCLAAAYAISCFVTSCCGRLNISIVFSLIMLLAIPICIGGYGSFLMDHAIGIDNNDAVVSILSAVPPFGFIYEVYYSFNHTLFRSFEFAVASPKVIILIAFAAVPTIASYLIAKHRNAETVDKPFICKPLYTVSSFIISITGFGLIMRQIDVPAFVFPAVIFILAACIFIEYIRSRSKRTFWKGIVRFAVSAALCIVFAVISVNTDGLNSGKIIPRENEISSVRITSGKLSSNPVSDLIEDRAVISAILKEHKKLTENLDAFKADNRYSNQSLVINYFLKNGMTVSRLYNGHDQKSQDLISDFLTAVTEMPQYYNMTLLGVLEDPKKTCTEIRIELYKDIHGSFMVKQAAMEEFIERFHTDLLNCDKNSTQSYGSFGYMIYTYIDENGITRKFQYSLDESLTRTKEFLDNTDNLSQNISINIGNASASYRIRYFKDAPETNVYNEYYNSVLSCSFTADSAAARELISYFETSYSLNEEYSEKFMVTVNGQQLRIKKENERSALGALIKIIGEQVKSER